MLIQAAFRRGLPLPDVIRDAPRLLEGLEFYYEAFWQLDADRSFGPGRIPWTAIDRYARRHGIVGEEFDRLVELIGEMDRTYLALAKERTRQDGKDAGTTSDAGA